MWRCSSSRPPSLRGVCELLVKSGGSECLDRVPVQPWDLCLTTPSLYNQKGSGSIKFGALEFGVFRVHTSREIARFILLLCLLYCLS